MSANGMLQNLQPTQSLDQSFVMTPAFLLGVLVRVLLAFGISGYLATRYEEVTSWLKIFTFGMAFNGLLAGLLTPLGQPEPGLPRAERDGTTPQTSPFPSPFSMPRVVFAQSDRSKASSNTPGQMQSQFLMGFSPSPTQIPATFGFGAVFVTVI